MTTEQALAFEIEVLSENTSEDELDRMTRRLLRELKDAYKDAEINMVSVGSPPAGSKGDALATLTMSALPLVLPGMVEAIKEWASRAREPRTVRFKGKGIEFEGTPEELQKLLDALEKRKKKK